MSNTLSFADGTELVFKTPPWATWNLDVHRNDSRRNVAHAIDPETGRNIAIHERDCLYRRREVGSRPGERLAEYRRLKLSEIDVDEQENVWLEFDTGERYSAKGVLSLRSSRQVGLGNAIYQTGSMGAAQRGDGGKTFATGRRFQHRLRVQH